MLWDTIKPGQGALIGSVVGFLALAGATVFNASMERTRQELHRTEQRLSLAAALSAEIAHNVTRLENQLDNVDHALSKHEVISLDEGIAGYGAREFNDVYESRSGDLGLFDPDLAHRVVAAYGHMVTLRYALAKDTFDRKLADAARYMLGDVKKTGEELYLLANVQATQQDQGAFLRKT